MGACYPMPVKLVKLLCLWIWTDDLAVDCILTSSFSRVPVWENLTGQPNSFSTSLQSLSSRGSETDAVAGSVRIAGH